MQVAAFKIVGLCNRRSWLHGGQRACLSREADFGTDTLELFGERFCFLLGDFLFEPNRSTFYSLLRLLEAQVENGSNLLDNLDLRRGIKR